MRNFFYLFTVIGIILQGCSSSNEILKKNDMNCTYHNDPAYKLQFVESKAITDCEGNYWNDDLDNLNNWDKRTNKANELFEPCNFLPENVELDNGVLRIHAYSKGKTGDDYYGGQITSKPVFGPEQDATYSCIMKPSIEYGIVNAFFFHWMGDLKSTDRCEENNHEIDIEITRDSETHLRCAFTTWRRAQHYFATKQPVPDYESPEYDRIACTSYILLPISYAESFHKYGIKWSKERIDFYVDDKVVSTHKTDDPVLKVVPTNPSHIKINTWVANWANKPQDRDVKGYCEVKKVCVEK